jgi:hypothetical protein
LSLLQVRTRTHPSRVMTSRSNRARHELIQLPTIIKVRPLPLGTRRQSETVPGTVPDLPGDGDAPPSPSPIRPESGTLPRPLPRFGGDGARDAPPSPIPIGGSAPWTTTEQGPARGLGPPRGAGASPWSPGRYHHGPRARLPVTVQLCCSGSSEAASAELAARDLPVGVRDGRWQPG